MKKYLHPLIVIPCILGLVSSAIVFLKFQEIRSFRQAINTGVKKEGTTLDTSLLRAYSREATKATVSDFKSGIVLMIYLSPTCSACRREIGLIKSNLEAVKSKVKIYGVTLEDPSKARKYAEEMQLPFQVLSDTGGRLREDLEISLFPSKFLVVDGVVRKTWFGSSPYIDTLLGELSL